VRQVAFITTVTVPGVETPNYKETHYRFGEKRRNRNFKDEKSDCILCIKYEVEVMPAFVCDNWERDGVLRVHQS
jgi:hypothetical protein